MENVAKMLGKIFHRKEQVRKIEKINYQIIFLKEMEEFVLMKGNEAIAEAAIRAGTDGYFGYPITPQSEVIEYLAAAKPHERTGMVVLIV